MRCECAEALYIIAITRCECAEALYRIAIVRCDCAEAQCRIAVLRCECAEAQYRIAILMCECAEALYRIAITRCDCAEALYIIPIPRCDLPRFSGSLVLFKSSVGTNVFDFIKFLYTRVAHAVWAFLRRFVVFPGYFPEFFRRPRDFPEIFPDAGIFQTSIRYFGTPAFSRRLRNFTFFFPGTFALSEWPTIFSGIWRTLAFPDVE